jgi:hypothetical protein
MKSIRGGVVILMSAVAAAALPGSAQTSSPSPAATLAPLAFLTAHEWDAKLSDTPGEKKRKIHAQFKWAPSGQAIRISNQFVTDGGSVPYIDGLYAWDPQQRVIVFWYVGAEGSFTQGTVRSEAGTLMHQFKQTQADGKTAEFVARVTPHEVKGWENEIFARSEKGLIPIAKVQYEAAD